MNYKIFPCEIKSIDEKNRTIKHSISSESVDRYNEILKADGANTKNYLKNPVVLWLHGFDGAMRGRVPIATNLSIYVDGSVMPKQLMAETQFYDDDFSLKIFRMYQHGFLKAWSVGLLPDIKSSTYDDETGVRTFNKWELLEYSAVPVPANPDALTSAMSKGLITDNDVKSFSSELDENGLPKFEDSTKPYPNEHSCRLKEPSAFQPDSFRRTEREHEGKKYSVIMGKLKGESTMTEQAYRYARDTWTADQARNHCKSHDGNFEAASGGKCESCDLKPEEEIKLLRQALQDKAHQYSELVDLNLKNLAKGLTPEDITALEKAVEIINKIKQFGNSAEKQNNKTLWQKIAEGLNQE